MNREITLEEGRNIRIYLDVPYNEKDEAKQYGAKFDWNIKKWYYYGPFQTCKKLTKWMLGEIIVFDRIYILEGTMKCHKCGKNTKVIAFGVGSHVSTEWDYVSDPDIDGYFLDEVIDDSSITIAYPTRKKCIPPALLDYMEEHYSIKKEARGINYCEHCGCILGQARVLKSDESPFFPHNPNDLKNINIKEIKLDFAIVLDWDVIYSWYLKLEGCETIPYLKFGKTEVIKIIADQRSDSISYKQMYEL